MSAVGIRRLALRLNGSPLVPWPTTVPPSSAESEERARWERSHDAAYDRMERELAAAGAPRRLISAWPADLRAEVERGWEHIFDLDAYPPDEYWQATAEELYADDVVSAVRPIWWL